LDANRPREADIAAEPARSSGHLPSWARSWVRRQFDAGWLRPSWPAELGGRDASAEEELIFLEEVARRAKTLEPLFGSAAWHRARIAALIGLSGLPAELSERDGAVLR
jgi:alkylation response protein AidB-like acyl-CoA dehydrogenase